jgi:chaperonin GroES
MLTILHKEVRHMRIQPLGTRVIVEPEKVEEKTSGGIYLPETAQEKPTIGTVIAVAENVKAVQAGDKVMFEKYGTKEIKDAEKAYILIDVKDILAKIN